MKPTLYQQLVALRDFADAQATFLKALQVHEAAQNRFMAAQGCYSDFLKELVEEDTP